MASQSAPRNTMSMHRFRIHIGWHAACLLALVAFSTGDHRAFAVDAGKQAETKPSETKLSETKPRETKPRETAKAAPEFAPKTKMGLKLAGLVTFVASSCPELQPDYVRFKSALGTLGLSTADLDRNEYKAAYLGYVLRYKEDKANNCARALKDFGPGGATVSDLVRPKGR